MYVIKEKRSNVALNLLASTLFISIMLFSIDMKNLQRERERELLEITTDANSNNTIFDMQVQAANNYHEPQLKSVVELLKDVEDINAAEISKITKGFMKDEPTFVLNIGPKKTHRQLCNALCHEIIR